jgi:high affinity sulfate transporter 1
VPDAPPRTALFFPSLHGYQRDWLTGDLIAGLTVWAVLVPEALAYASIAGVSPVVGLYAAPGALLLYAMFGSSRHLVVGPMAATAALSAAAVADLVTDPKDVLPFTIVVALMTGVIALLAGLLRLGFVANFISEPVLKGFIIGLALTIIIGQVPKLFGVPKGEGDFFEQTWDFLRHLGDTQWLTLLVGGLSLALVLALRRWVPIVPGSLVAVILGIIAVDLFHLDRHGVDIVGHIDSGLPTFGLPSGVGFHDYLAAGASAVGIMLVGFAEGLGAAKTYAARNNYEIDANRELIGLGASNLAAGLSSGMVVNGSLSKTAVNGGAGAKTQASGLVVALMTIVTLLFLTGLFEKLPEATLAAVVIAALIELVDVGSMIELWRTYTRRLGEIYGHAARVDFIAALAAMLGVLIFDTLPGLFIGIGTSLLLLLYRSSRPHVAELGRAVAAPDQFTDIERHPDNEVSRTVVVYRPESGLFFANAEAVRVAVLAGAGRDGVTAVVIDGESMPFIDVTAFEMLRQLAHDLDARGVRLGLAHGIGQVRDVISAEGTATGEGPVIELYPTVGAAVDALSAAGSAQPPPPDPSPSP